MTAALTDAELAKLEALHHAATPGPWLADFHHTRVTAGRRHAMVRVTGELAPLAAVVLGVEGCSEDEGRATASLIPAARNALPALLAEVREHRQRPEVEMTMGDLGLPIWAAPADNHFCWGCVYNSQCRDQGYCWHEARDGR